MSKRKLTTAQIAVLVAIATFGSNILGFVREMVMANYFGAGMITDAYTMGLTIPNTLLAAVITAVGTSYMPILAAKFEKQGDDDANRFTSELLNSLLLFIAIIYAISFVFSKQIVGIFAPGYDGEKQSLTIFYFRLAFITLFATVITSLSNSYSQYRGEFVKQKVVACLQNVFSISFIFLAAFYDYHLLIVGVVIGALVIAIWQFTIAKKNGLAYAPNLNLTGSVKEVYKLALPIFIGGSFSEINTFIDKMLASTLPEGSVTSLNYSGKIITLILTFTVGIFSTLIYPKLNQAFAQSDYKRISSLIEKGINTLSILTIPFAMGAMLYATEITKVVYERGAFDEIATRFVSVSFLFYAIRIPFYAVNTLLNNAYYSMHDTKATVYCSLIAVITNIALNFALVKPMGVGGLALATSVAECIGMLTRYIYFRFKYKEITLLQNKKKLLLILIFSMIAIIISYLVFILISSSIGSLLIRLGISVIAAMLAYLVMLYIAKFEELKLIRDLIK